MAREVGLGRFSGLIEGRTRQDLVRFVPALVSCLQAVATLLLLTVRLRALLVLRAVSGGRSLADHPPSAVLSRAGT